MADSDRSDGQLKQSSTAITAVAVAPARRSQNLREIAKVE